MSQSGPGYRSRPSLTSSTPHGTLLRRRGELVLSAIKELNYYKNSSARLLVRGKSDIVGMILSDIGNPFLPPLIKSFERAATAAGLDLLIGMTNYEQRKAESAVRRMIESRVRGVAVMTSQIDSRLVDAMLQAEVPVVALDWPRVGKGKSSLSIDYTTGIHEALEHLRELGHRDLGVIHGPANIVSAMRYEEHLRHSIREIGMTLVGSVESDNHPEGGAQAAEMLLRGNRRPTAILCGNDPDGDRRDGRRDAAGACSPARSLHHRLG